LRHCRQEGGRDLAEHTGGIAPGGTAAATAAQVADYLIHLSQRHGDPITNLKLQKLLYYAQGWHLAFFGRRLFHDQIQAWLRGPVVYGVWKKYSAHQWRPIGRRVPPPTLNPIVQGYLDSVFQAYQDCSAYTLEQMTHSEPPWRNARRGLGNREPSSAIIPIRDIEAYFLRRAHEPQS